MMFDFAMLELLILPLLAGIAVAFVSGPLGSFTVWRGMAYFGDTLAHSALLGVAAALIFDFNVQLGILFCCITIAALLLLLQYKNNLAIDSLLGIVSHSSLALGLVIVGLVPGSSIDLFAYLFGDLLTVSKQEIAIIFGVAVLSLGFIAFFWRSLLLISIDEDLAHAEGKNVTGLRLLLMMLMALVIAVAMKTVGILLITAMLIIPAATAQKLTRSPEAMVIVATIIAVLSVVVGVGFSAAVDAPTGPAIVLCASGFFSLSFLYRGWDF